MVNESKIANGLLAVSSGGVVAPVFGIAQEEIILYVLGFVVSIIAFAHAETHKNKSETLLKMIINAFRYIAVGVFTYPTAYVYAGQKVWAYSAFQGLAGVVATLVAVALLDAWIVGKSEKLKKG